MQNVAQTILQQLGGNRFIAMTGAKDLVSSPNSLQFKIGRGAKNGINCVRVTLANDLYVVDFFKLRKFDATIINTVGCVFADQLQRVFTEQTGFDTKL